jgi:hypothetical protein
MAPGEKAPFYLDFYAQSSSTQDLSWIPSVSRVLVTVTQVQDVNQRQYSDAKVSYDINYTDSSGLYVVRGTVVNNGNLVAQQPWVVTTFYDASGTVIGVNFTNYITSSLSPNGGMYFYAVPADNNTAVASEIKNYSFQVDSLTLTNSTSPFTTPTSSGSTSPTGQIPILPIVIVVVLVVIAIVSLILFRSRRKPLPPPPPIS